MKDINQLAARLVKEATEDSKAKDKPKKKAPKVSKTKGASKQVKN